ncbi:BEL1-like homeodomain 3 [Perilla frutescens var. hirtella]|nr:BEL1-like homeodomain 3 [Perilla frutescens var. frutescens]KAH6776522.1 BEL1-like homeodomain 3 [Perilla frutescens var. hirtella]
MASFYSKDEEDMIPNSYLANQRLASYSSSGNSDNSKVHVSQPSLLSYQNSMSRDQYSIGISRDEMVMQQIDMQLNNTPRNSDTSVVISDNRVLNNESMHAKSSQHFPQYHTLSLSLGSPVQLHSDLRPDTNSNLCLLSSSDMQSGAEFSQNDLNNVQYACFGMSRDTVQYGAMSEFQNLTSSKDTCFVPSIQQEQIYIGRLCNSTYLNATQDLLDELVNVHRAPNKPMVTVHNIKGLGQIGHLGAGVTKDGASAELQESNINNGCRDISPSECLQDLRNKHMKLLGMLDEVVRRFKQYEHQMQAVVSSFEMVAGRGAALPYTLVPLQTISRRFRCVRDAIKKQIKATQRSLEEPDVHSNGVGVLSRLRYVDQQLREQKALQQFGVVRQPWRPQRGLPETAVSLLRAWLFEHFLHPYPTESEKMVLARDTGLTRSQVANWFINARVRLWKPMIEEIYKEEFGEAETDSSRPSPAHGTTAGEISEQDCQGRSMSADAYALFPDNNALPNKTADENDVGTSRSQVSLVLGLQHTKKDSSKHIADGIQSKGNDDSSSSMVLDKLECYYMGLPNDHNMFSNSTYLLSDFVT